MSALLWSGADILFRNATGFVSTILLTRLLRPEDFGAVAALDVFLGLAATLVDSGLSSALIQNAETTHEQESIIFYFNVSAATVLAALLCLAAPWIATFYGDPNVRWLTYAMALNLWLTGLTSIHTTLLQKQLNFRSLAKVGMIANVSSVVVAVVLAYRGFGVWSLVLRTLTATCLTVVLLWVVHRWRPALKFQLASIRGHLRFGSYMLLNGLLNTADANLNSLLIARLFSTRDLGFYNRAQSTQQLPLALVAGVLNRVALPLFSQAAAQAEPGSLLAAMRRAQLTSMWLNMPATLGLTVIAEPFVVTLFGERWRPCIPILQVLTLGGVLWPLHMFNLNALLAQGRSDLYLRVSVIKKLVIVTSVVLASLHSVLAVAWAQAISTSLVFFVNSYYTGRLLGYGARAQLRDLIPYTLLTIPMVCLLWLVSEFVSLPHLPKLILLILLGIVSYLAASWQMKIPAMREALGLLGRMRRPRAPAQEA